MKYKFFQSRKGVLVYLAIFAIIVISTLTIAFHQVSIEAQFTSHRFELAEIARQIAKSAIDEAYFGLKTDVDETFSISKKKPKSKEDFRGLILSFSPGQKPPVAKEIPTPKTQEEAKKWLEKVAAVDVKAEIGFVDFRNKAEYDFDGSKPPTFEFHRNEGMGTLEISARVTLKKGGKIVASCRLARHHEYKVFCLVSGSTNRTKYHQSFLLDYALFVQENESFPNFATITTELIVSPSNDTSKPGKIFSQNTEYTMAASPWNLEDDLTGTPIYTPNPNQPKFYDARNPGTPLSSVIDPKFQPFAFRNLDSQRFKDQGDLERAGILDSSSGMLNLSGMIAVEGATLGSVTLEGKGGGDLIFRGAGILIADLIIIKSGIKKRDPDADLCILVASRIIIDTDQEIQAGLFAIHNPRFFVSGPSGGAPCIGGSQHNPNCGTVKLGTPKTVANILGCLGARKLIDTDPVPNWPATDSSINVSYDPVFQQDKPNEVFQIDIGPRINFQRLTAEVKNENNPKSPTK